jgi:hypothetical protein
MTFTVIVPAALLPAGSHPELVSDLPLTGLARLAWRADESVLAGGVAQALCTLLGIERGDDWPLAPFAARGEGLNSGRGHWLLATPVQASVGHSDVMLASCRLPMTSAQADTLLRDLGAHFSADGLFFLRGERTGEWYINSSEPVRLATTPPVPVPGGALLPFLPCGIDAPKWRRWISEMQMLLHDHPVNAERERAGLPRVDALWIWGAGAADAAARSRGVRAFVDDGLVEAIARGAGVPVAGNSAEGIAALESRQPFAGHALIQIERFADALGAGDLAGWKAALVELDRLARTLLVPRGDRHGDVELILGGSRQALQIVPRRAPTLLRRVPRLRKGDGQAVLKRWQGRA